MSDSRLKEPSDPLYLTAIGSTQHVATGPRKNTPYNKIINFGDKLDITRRAIDVTIDVRDASELNAGGVALATQAEVDAGIITNKAITPATLSSYSGLVSGGVATVQDEPAGTGESLIGDGTGSATNVRLHSLLAGTNMTVTKTGQDLVLAANIAAASDTVAGISELATQAEVNTGTDTARVVTPATLAGITSLKATTSLIVNSTKVVGSQVIVPASLSNSTGGTAGSSIADGTGTYSQTIFNNNFASIVAQLNAIEAALTSHGLIASL